MPLSDVEQTDQRVPLQEKMKEIAQELFDREDEEAKKAADAGDTASEANVPEGADSQEAGASGADSDQADDDGATSQGEVGQDTPDAADAETVEVPSFWADEARLAKFKELPEDIQDILIEREKAQADNEAQLSEFSQLKQTYEPIHKAFEPVRDRMSALGASEADYLQTLIAADRYLQQKPEEALRWLAQRYGVSPQAGQTQQPSQDDAGTGYVDPLERQVAALSQQLTQQQSALQQQAMQSQQAEMARTIQAFIDVEDNGQRREDRINDHKEAFEAEFVNLSKAYPTKRALELAYQIAVPQTASKKADPPKTDRVVLERAKRANAANVKESGDAVRSAGGEKLKGKNIRETVMKVAASLGD